MDEKGQKFVSLIITIMMVISTLAIVGNTTAKQPEDVPTDGEEISIPDLQVTELRAETPVICLSQTNRLVLSVANHGNANAKKVTANVTDIIPNESEELITTLHFGALNMGKEKTRFVDWYPTQRGIHYIKVEIKYEYLNHSSPAVMVEGPPTILSVGFPVTPLGTTVRWGPGGQPVYDDDSTIYAGEVREVEGTSADHLTIQVWDGDLTIKGPAGGDPGGILRLNEEVTLVMMEPDRGVYDIIVEDDATFEINGGAKTTTIQSPSGNLEFTYPFYNYGTVSFTGANVLYTYGPSDTSLAGGIQNLPGSTCIIDNCQLLEADTHSLYIEGTADVQVRGSNTIIGRDTALPNPDVTKGHGIFVNGATPVIEDVTVQYQKQDGIHIQNSVSQAPILAADLHNYASSKYDYRLTYAAEESMRPIISSGNGATYLVFQRPGINEIFFKKTTDEGRSWSNEIMIASSPNIGNMDFAADGTHLSLVWEAYDMSTSIYVIYSDNSGVTWTAPYLIQNGYWPSVAVDGARVYVAYRFITFSGPDFLMSIQLTYGDNGVLDEETVIANPNNGEFGGIPKVVVGGGVVHIVVADLTPSTPYIYYWQSLDDGATWLYCGAIGTWTYSGTPTWDFTEYFSLDAEGSQVSLVWNNYSGINYEMKGKYSSNNGDDWYPINIPSSTGNSLYPAIAIDTSGNIVLTYQNDRDGTNRIFAQRFDASGNSLGAETSMTPDTSGATVPSISIDSSGYAYLAWADVRNGNSEIYIKRSHQLVVSGTKSLSNDKNGIEMDYSTGIIAGNYLTDNYNGIYIYYSNNNIIIDNTASRSITYGIYLDHSIGNTITHNTASSNSWGGIYLHSSSDNTITNNTVFRNNNYGIYLESSSSNNNITSNKASNNAYGIHLSSSSNNTITNNNASTNSYIGISLTTSNFNSITNNTASTNLYFGICLRTTNNNTISKNNASANYRDGIRLENSSNNNITHNTVSSNINYYGILLQYSTSNTIVNNSATNNALGIYLYYSSSNTITNNTASSNLRGIFLLNSGSNTISNNTVSSNTNYGIWLYTSNNNIIVNNTASNNNYGIYLSDYSSSNSIYHNNIIGNTNQASDDGTNQWNNGYPSGGNYWSDWTSPDGNSDGFVDNPRLITGGSNKDNWPFTTQDGWLNNPPTAPIVDLTPDNPTTTDDLTCTVTTPSIDPDGDTITYTYEWYRFQGAGFVLQPGLTSVTTALFATISSSNTVTGELWMCIVTPNDGIVNGLIGTDWVPIG
jgi:parallel beta-helix repeat protein